MLIIFSIRFKLTYKPIFNHDTQPISTYVFNLIPTFNNYSIPSIRHEIYILNLKKDKYLW